MKFVIAPDSFKGCMTAKQAGEAIRAAENVGRLIRLGRR